MVRDKKALVSWNPCAGRPGGGVDSHLRGGSTPHSTKQRKIPGTFGIEGKI